ncbi:MAG: hypothetical protein LBE01_02215 [Deltaproteobacteria bacterium]|jgi:hypothetical protein|nr:hypothetical protein [Deltaproteobacteria bacterium]
MKSWLPFLVTELREGRDAILAVWARDEVAKAAALDGAGRALAGEDPRNDPDVASLNWAEAAASLKPGEPLALESGRFWAVAEKLAPATLGFWEEALVGQEKAWAAWLLTMVERSEEKPKVVRHLLAAVGPWTTPRIPPEAFGQWSLLPLNAALGALLVFGDDDLALETAALGARAGLRVKLVTKRPVEDLKPALTVGKFAYRGLGDWSEVNPENLTAIGLKPGVFVLVTARDNGGFLPAVQAAPTGWLGLAGAAAEKSGESGLFPEAITPAQKALGILAAMLERCNP